MDAASIRSVADASDRAGDDRPGPGHGRSLALPIAVAVALLVPVLAGCVGTADEGPASDPVTDLDAGTDDGLVLGCQVLDVDHEPIDGATCRFSFGTVDVVVPVDADGAAEATVPPGTGGRVEGSAPGMTPKAIDLHADLPKRVRFVLAAAADPGGSGGTDGSDGGTPPTDIGPGTRRWTRPVTVGSDNVNEPLIQTDRDGTVYFSPTRKLYRSLDGGATWDEVSPTLPEALPWTGGGTDTSVDVAPDGTVWWTRFWGYVGPTLGCTSADRGGTWTCDNLALPGPTDRMWILGLSRTDGYLATTQAFSAFQWATTDDGSGSYDPHAVHQAFGFLGNMVHDEVHDAIWQTAIRGGRMHLLRIDDAQDLRISRFEDTGVPHTFGLTALSEADGTLWLAGEPRKPDGSRSVIAARSTDRGASWEWLPVSMAPASATFATVAAGPDGRAAVAYYGSDTPGPPNANGGTWSVYVAETWDADAAHPTWVETRLVDRVHEGSICAGVACAQEGGDPAARYAGDFMGVWVDAWGHVHVGYVEDERGSARNADYVRQVPVDGTVPRP